MNTKERRMLKERAKRVAEERTAAFARIMQEMDPVEIERMLRQVGEEAQNRRYSHWSESQGADGETFIGVSLGDVSPCPQELSDKGNWYMELRRLKIQSDNEVSWQISFSWFPYDEYTMTPEEAAKDDEHDSISHVYSEWMPLSGDGNWWADLVARNAWDGDAPIDKYSAASDNDEDDDEEAGQ